MLLDLWIALLAVSLALAIGLLYAIFFVVDGKIRLMFLSGIATTLGFIGCLISAAAVLLLALAEGPPVDYAGWDYSPIAWSPDGSHLAFGVGEDMWPSTTLIVMDVDGSHVQRLIFTEDDERFEARNLYGFVWDQSGERIFFKNSDSGEYDDFVPQDEQAYVITVADRTVQPVAADDFPAARPGKTAIPRRHQLPATHRTTRPRAPCTRTACSRKVPASKRSTVGRSHSTNVIKSCKSVIRLLAI